MVITAQEINSQPLSDLTLFINLVLSLLPPVLFAKQLTSYIKQEKEENNDIMFILGLVMIDIVLILFALVLTFLMTIVLLNGTYVILLLPAYATLSYTGTIAAEKVSQITEKTDVKQSITRWELVFGTVLGILVANPQKRVVTWLCSMIAVILLYLVIFL